MNNAIMQLAPDVVHHLMKALETEITRLEKIAETVGDDWPDDYDPNDLVLFHGGLSELRETAEKYEPQELTCGKYFSFIMALLPGYVRENLANLPVFDYSLLFHAYTEFTIKCCLRSMSLNPDGTLFKHADWINRYVVRRLAGFPDRAELFTSNSAATEINDTSHKP